MNKVILSLLLAVCILGMALIMLNERLGRKSEPVPAPTAEAGEPAAPDSGAGLPPLSTDAAHAGQNQLRGGCFLPVHGQATYS